MERWWRDSSDSKKESFVNLVKNGQLEIVGGGWVMNDEVIYMGFVDVISCHLILNYFMSSDGYV